MEGSQRVMGGLAELELLLKGAGHKYLRRIPTGNPKRKWNYIYSKRSKHHDGEFHAGEKFKLTHGGKSGHYEVKATHGPFVTLKHDESGHEVSVHRDKLAQMFTDEHHQDEAKGAPAAAKAFESSVTAKKRRTAKAHEQAASDHDAAADAGAKNAQLHRELAVVHRRVSASEMAKLSLKVDKKYAFTIKLDRKPKPGYLGTKGQAWTALMAEINASELPRDFNVADEKYKAWKEQRAQKPHPWEGGELDSVNEALDLKKPGKFEGTDNRVTGLRDAFDRLTIGVKRWDDPKLGEALQILKKVPGLATIRVPQAERTRMQAKGVDKAEEEYYREMKGREQDLDSSYDPDEIGSNADLDDSFDFGFNVVEALKSMSGIDALGDLLQKGPHKYVKRTGSPGNYKYEYTDASGKPRSVPSRGAAGTKEPKAAVTVDETGAKVHSIPGTSMGLVIEADPDRKDLSRYRSFRAHLVNTKGNRSGDTFRVTTESGTMMEGAKHADRGSADVPTGAMSVISDTMRKVVESADAPKRSGLAQATKQISNKANAAEAAAKYKQGARVEYQGTKGTVTETRGDTTMVRFDGSNTSAEGIITTRLKGTTPTSFSELTQDQKNVLNNMGPVGSYTSASDALVSMGLIEDKSGALTDKGHKFMSMRTHAEQVAGHENRAETTTKYGDYRDDFVSRTKKSGDGIDDLEALIKGDQRVDEWASQFIGTPLYLKALQLTKDRMDVAKQHAECRKNQKSYSDLEELPRAKRQAERDRQRKEREKIENKGDAVDVQCKELAEKLIQHRIDEEKRMGKSGDHLDELDALIKGPPDELAEPEEVLLKGDADGIESLDALLKGAGPTVGATVTGSPQKDFGDAGAISGDNAAGAGAMPHGDTQFSSHGPEDGDEASGSPAGSPPSHDGGAESAKKNKLSEDDVYAEQQLHDGNVHELRKGDAGMRLTPARQIDMVAHEHAIRVGQLSKSERVRPGFGIGPAPIEAEEGEVLDKSTTIRHGITVMSDKADLAIEEMQKGGESFYHGAAPTLDDTGLLRKSVTCPNGHTTSAMFSSCQACGVDAGLPVSGGGGMFKSNRGVVAEAEQRINITHGVCFEDE